MSPVAASNQTAIPVVSGSALTADASVDSSISRATYYPC